MDGTLPQYLELVVPTSPTLRWTCRQHGLQKRIGVERLGLDLLLRVRCGDDGMPVKVVVALRFLNVQKGVELRFGRLVELRESGLLEPRVMAC